MLTNCSYQMVEVIFFHYAIVYFLQWTLTSLTFLKVKNKQTMFVYIGGIYIYKPFILFIM